MHALCGDLVARVDDGRADDAGDDDADDEDAVHLAETAREPARAEDDQRRQYRVWDVDQCRLQAGEAERFDDQVCKVLGAAVRDALDKLDAKDEPCFRIDERFLR